MMIGFFNEIHLDGITRDSIIDPDNLKIVDAFERCMRTKNVNNITSALHKHLITHTSICDVDYPKVSILKKELDYEGGIDRLSRHIANMSHTEIIMSADTDEDAVRVNILLMQAAQRFENGGRPIILSWDSNQIRSR